MSKFDIPHRNTHHIPTSILGDGISGVYGAPHPSRPDNLQPPLEGGAAELLGGPLARGALPAVLQ